MGKKRRMTKRRKRVKGPMDYVKVRLGSTYTLQAKGDTSPEWATGEVACYFNIRNLGITYVPNNQDQTRHFALDNYAKWQDLFDSYRVQYIKIEYRPDQNIVSSVLPSTPQMPPGYVCIDFDNGGGMDLASIINHKNARVVDFKKPFKVGYKIPKYTDDANPQGWQNLQATSGHFTGTIQIVSQGLVEPAPTGEGSNIGTLKVSYIVEFKNRVDNNIPAYFGVGSTGATLTTYPTMSSDNQSFLAAQGDGDSVYFEFNG